MIKRRLWVLPVGLLLLFAALVALRWAMADLYHYQARFPEERWAKEGRYPSQAELDLALKNIDTSLSWKEAVPDALDLKGFLLWHKILLRQLEGDISQQEIDVIAAQAAQLHRRAIELRPRWPYSWASLALMKAYQGQFDQEYLQAIDRAVHFGPWENTVNIHITQAGMMGWFKLSPDARQQVIQNSVRGLRRNYSQVSGLLKYYQKTLIVCAHLPTKEPLFKRLCR